MHRICVVGRTYEQAYPQKLGREFGGNNIVDSSHKTPVDITSFSLSMGFLEDKSWKGNFFGSGGALLLAGLLLGLRERGLGNREDGTHGSLQPLKWRFESRHGQHSITSTWEVYNDSLQWICISFITSSRCT